MKLLISSYEITIYLLFLVIASIAVYIAAFWFLSYYSALADDFGVFGHLMTFTETYWTMFFFCFSYVLIDAGLRYASVEINQIYMKRMEIQELRLKYQKAASAKNAVKELISYSASKYCIYLFPFYELG